MNIWTIANQKGGVGKTTMAVSLAGLLSSNGFQVLVIDLDPQASLTCYFSAEKKSLHQNAYQLFHRHRQYSAAEMHELILSTQFEHLDLLCSHPALATLDRQSGKKGGLGLVMSKSLQPLAREYDYIIIDCPPALSVLLVNALACCDKLIVPVQTEFLAVKALDRIMQSVRMVEQNRQRPITKAIVPTLFDPMVRTSHLVIAALQSKYKKHLWHSAIPLDAELREASFQGKLPSLFAPHSRAVFAYCALLDWLIRPDEAFSHNSLQEAETA